VTRKGTVAVPAGDFELICSELPDYFIPQSLNVSAMGDVKTDILNINVERCNPMSKKSKRYTELKRKLEDCRRSRRDIRSSRGSSKIYGTGWMQSSRTFRLFQRRRICSLRWVNTRPMKRTSRLPCRG
ncbi:MAG: hypothetical protein B6D63_06150, partial [Candidatus Latescibacteria bacterium 4484_7]